MKKRVTLKQIAEKLNVSVASVSYVLNNKEKKTRVSEKMAALIRDTAKEMQYRPNHAARSLRENRQMSIGCILADISNPFFAELARKVEDEANKHNYTVIFGSSDEDKTKFCKLIDLFVSRQLDGFLIAPAEETRNEIKKIQELNIPVVLFDRYYDDIGANYVVIDNYKASKNLVESLIIRGKKRIGMIAHDSKMLHFKKRKEGYSDALNDFGLNIGKDLLMEVNHLELQNEVNKAIKLLVLDKHVDAIVFEANSLVEQGLRFIVESDLIDSEQIEISAFDQSNIYSFYPNNIEYVKQPLKKMAEEAVKMLINLIENGNSAQYEIYLDSVIQFEQELNKISIKA